MKLHELEQYYYDIIDDLEQFMLKTSGEHYSCAITFEHDTALILLESDMEFIELVMDEFEEFYLDVMTPTFKYEDEVLDYLADYEV
jgi:hypothetical protein